jgi:hypothetical protein
VNPVEKLLQKLPSAKKVGKGWSALCPAHEDRKASLSVSEGKDGSVLVKCHAGCDTAAILSAIGLTLPDLFPPRADPTPSQNGKSKTKGPAFPTAMSAVAELERKRGKPTAVWTYEDGHGEAVGLVVRWDGRNGKEIRPVACHRDGWRISAMPEPRPLYRLPALAKAGRVIVCEGEKAADAAGFLGFTATTSAGGCQAPQKTDWRHLAGKEVWILPDNDAAGRKYAERVASMLGKLRPVPVVRVIELPRLPEGGDIADWIETHGEAAEPEGMRKEIEALAQRVAPGRSNLVTSPEFQPFPVDALPEPIRGFVKAGATAIGCDPSYLALPLLTGIGAAIGNTRRLRLKRGWLVPAILWCAVVGESGTAKTPAFRLVMRPFRKRQSEALKRYTEEITQYEADLARWEKQRAAWKHNKKTDDDPPRKPVEPVAERSIVSDTTVEALAPILLANPRGLLLARDELAGWIGSFDRYAGKGKASADAANWLSMFNAETVIIDRKTGIPRIIYVPRAAVCVSGGIQPAILQRALGIEHRESGLGARLLLAWPPRKPKRWTEADIDPNLEAELVRLVDHLYQLHPMVDENGEAQPVSVRLAAEAKSAWTAYYNAHAIEQTSLTGDLSAAWSKLEEYAARLALIVHFSRWAANDPSLANPDILDAASMTAGIALATWFKHEAQRVYGMLNETEEERDQRRLVEWIQRRGEPVTAREVQQNCRWLKEPGAAEAALDELIDAGHGYWEPSPPGQRGQPTRRFRLHMPSTVYGNGDLPEKDTNTVDVDTVDAGKPQSQRQLFRPDNNGPYK